MTEYLRLEAFRATPLESEPFPHLVVPGFVSAQGLDAINADYPTISSPGSFPTDQVTFGPAFQTLLDELDIARLARSKASVLSGGERRKVEITRALVLDPMFLCLDEPFAGIDPITVVEIQRIITYLKERGIGIVISDHNVHATLSIIDRAYVIHAGKILFHGGPREIVDSDIVRQVFLGERFRLAR